MKNKEKVTAVTGLGARDFVIHGSGQKRDPKLILGQESLGSGGG